VMVMLMFLTMVIMGTSLLGIWSSDAMKLKAEKDSLQAYYTAYSVAYDLWVYIQNENRDHPSAQQFLAVNNNTWSDPQPFGDNGRSSFKVMVSREPDATDSDKQWIIITTQGIVGKYNSKIRLTVKEYKAVNPDGMGGTITTYQYSKEKWENKI